MASDIWAEQSKYWPAPLSHVEHASSRRAADAPPNCGPPAPARAVTRVAATDAFFAGIGAAVGGTGFASTEPPSAKVTTNARKKAMRTVSLVKNMFVTFLEPADVLPRRLRG